MIRNVALHRNGQAAKHLNRGQRLFGGRQYAQAAREYALAYIFDSRPEVLIEVARACRKAEMDEVAQAIFARILDELPDSRYQNEIEEELKRLNYSLESAELNRAEILRYQMDLAKREFQAGNFASALFDYALAYSVKPLPRLKFNTAQAYRRDNHAKEAYILYTSFLEEEPTSPIHNEVLGYLKELRAPAFPPPLHKRPLFWIPLTSAVLVAVATSLGLGYGLPRSQPPSKPVLMFDFP